MNKTYELAVILHPDLEIDVTGGLAKVEKILGDNKAEIEKTDNWGKRKLAYQIERQDHGIYVFYTVSMPGENVAKLDSTLNITTEVIRHLIVKPGPESNPPEIEEKDDKNEKDNEKKES